MLERIEAAADRQRRFVADAAHELRTPLTRMRTELEVDLAHPAGGPDGHRASVLAEVEGLQRLVIDLLDLARTDAATIAQPVALDRLVLEVVESARPGTETVIETTMLDPVAVIGQEGALRRLVANLVDNAVRHGSDHVILTLHAEAGIAELAVTDDGPGIPPVDAERIFERFTLPRRGAHPRRRRHRPRPGDRPCRCSGSRGHHRRRPGSRRRCPACRAPPDMTRRGGMAVAGSSSLPTGDSRRLLATRGVRALVDGMVATVLPAYLIARGLGPTEVGAVITATLLGSAVVTLLLGLRGGHLDRIRVLRVVALLMIATGVAFGLAASFVVLVVIATVGTLNPSGGDVSPFLPIEQSLLPDTVPPERRTHVFARYSLVASLAGSFGALAAGLPEMLTERTDVTELESLQAVFFAYAMAGVVALFLYRRLLPLSPIDLADRSAPRAAQVARHRPASGRAVRGGLVRRGLHRPGDHRPLAVAPIRHGHRDGWCGFFWSGLFTAGSALLAPRLAGRIGLIRTMVYTHLPANALVIGAAARCRPSSWPWRACWPADCCRRWTSPPAPPM